MKRWCFFAVIAMVGLTLLGCVPRRLFWSPNGQQAVILGAKGIYLADSSGKLSDLVATEVSSVAWFKDSRRLVAVRTEPATDWNAVTPLLSKEKQAQLIALAKPLREELLAYTGEWKDFHPSVAARITGGELMALLLYLRDHDNGDLAQRLGLEWKMQLAMAARIYHLQVYEVSGQSARAGKIIYSSIDGPDDLRVSPNGKWVVITAQMSGDVPNPVDRLMIVPVDRPAPATTIAERVAAFPDWSPDGTALCYGTTRDVSYGTKASEGQTFTLGTLTRRRVLDSAGELLSPPGDPEDLVGLMFWQKMKVCCLSDGRILFSSCEVKLPITTAEMPQQTNLFMIDPDRQPAVTRMLSNEADPRLEGISLGEFDLSPDEKRVVVVGEGSKTIAVITLATGKIETLYAAEHTPKEQQSMPAWRTAEELSLLLPPGARDGSPDSIALVMFTLDGKGRVMSKDWPAIFTEDAAPTSAP